MHKISRFRTDTQRSEAQAYLQNTMRVPVSAVMESLLADLAQLEQPLLLVLDDLHLIQDRELLAALNRLIKFAPAAFTARLLSMDSLAAFWQELTARPDFWGFVSIPFVAAIVTWIRDAFRADEI